MKCLLYIALAVCFTTVDAQFSPRFPVKFQNKIGFIDSSGKVVVPPVFRSVDVFSEGLCPVREEGKYGFINEFGNWVIPANYEYACPFVEGVAIVFLKGEPLFIDKSGNPLFKNTYPKVGNFNQGLALVQTKDEKCGIINKSGLLVVDTIYYRISSLKNGVFIVVGRSVQDERNAEDMPVGIIDSDGNVVVPFGKYEQIDWCGNSLLYADIPAEPWDTIDGFTSKTVFLSPNGQILGEIPSTMKSYFGYNFNEGLASITVDKDPNTPGSENWSYDEKSYTVVINAKGKMLVNDTNHKDVGPFHFGKAFVKNWANEYYLIDSFGRLVNKNVYQGVVGEKFFGGIAFVTNDGITGIIDTSGNYIVPHRFQGVQEAGIFHDCFVFMEEVPGTDKEENTFLFGLASLSGQILVPAVLEDLSQVGFENGLLYAKKDGVWSYFNRNGQIVWKEDTSSLSGLQNVNIDYMNRGYYYAGGPGSKYDLGGYGRSRNYARKANERPTTPRKQLSLLALTFEKDTVFEHFEGFTLVLCNRSGSKIQFNAQDSRLPIVLQAKNEAGEWQDIEYIPRSWCGNSYHTLVLENKSYWEFPVIKYSGDYTTLMRFVVQYVDPNDKANTKRMAKVLNLYSNEFTGSLNLAQFWRKPGYTPAGIMDPYNE